MPIRKDLRRFYGPTWKKVTRPRILARDHHQCAFCGVPNHQYILRAGSYWRIDQPGEHWISADGEILPKDFPIWKVAGKIRTVYVVLTVAHMNHQSGDDRDENLKALCAYCHFKFDKDHHRDSRATRKDKTRPLLQGVLNA